MGSGICTRTDEELHEFLETGYLQKILKASSEPLIKRLLRLLKTGYMFDYDDWVTLLFFFFLQKIVFVFTIE